MDVERFRQQLLDWFSVNQRKLPWRQHPSLYEVWLSEVMLQQTQVQTVLRYYSRFLNRFPSLESVAEATEEDVLKIWEGLGYYSRVRNFHRAARMVVEKFHGQIPAQYDQFRALPGVGDYIASAVLSIGLNQPLAVVDGNVKRVIARLFLLTSPIKERETLRQIRAKAELLLDRREPGNFNQAMMELGATVCVPRRPDCQHCPVANFCRARREEMASRIPVRSPRKSIPEYEIAVGVVVKKGKLLITRRKSQGLLGGLWEFPGGKIRSGESPEKACVREIQEEVNLRVRPFHLLTTVKHTYSHFKIRLTVYVCIYQNGRVRLNGPVDFRWVSPGTLGRFAFPGANHKFIPLLKHWLKENKHILHQ